MRSSIGICIDRLTVITRSANASYVSQLSFNINRLANIVFFRNCIMVRIVLYNIRLLFSTYDSDFVEKIRRSACK